MARGSVANVVWLLALFSIHVDAMEETEQESVQLLNTIPEQYMNILRDCMESPDTYDWRELKLEEQNDPHIWFILSCGNDFSPCLYTFERFEHGLHKGGINFRLKKECKKKDLHALKCLFEDHIRDLQMGWAAVDQEGMPGYVTFVKKLSGLQEALLFHLFDKFNLGKDIFFCVMPSRIAHLNIKQNSCERVTSVLGIREVKESAQRLAIYLSKLFSYATHDLPMLPFEIFMKIAEMRYGCDG